MLAVPNDQKLLKLINSRELVACFMD